VIDERVFQNKMKEESQGGDDNVMMAFYGRSLQPPEFCSKRTTPFSGQNLIDFIINH
jgi:hypothetical protein